MTYHLLLVDADGVATTSQLFVRQLREFHGAEGLSVHFRPVRSDRLFESAKAAGALAYKILSGEGIVRSQLWVEYELRGAHVNVSGRSSDLLFALALITARWRKATGEYPAIAATGVLDADSGALSANGAAAVQAVQHTLAKIAAAIRALAHEPEAVIFYPAADAQSVKTWSDGANVPPRIRLEPVSCLEDALALLGITLHKIYLGNPYRGLAHFDYEHRSIFFGRDTEIREVLTQLLRREAAGTPGVLVEGASGSGKSSFLRAGVLPALVNPASQSTEIEEALEHHRVRGTVSQAIWRAGLLPSGADEARIAQSICDCWRQLPELTGKLGVDVTTLADLATRRREAWPAGQRFVWLLDQLEELFGVGLDPSVIDSFGGFLLALQTDGVWTLASIRADAVPQLKQHHSLRRVFGSNEGQYYLETIAATALDDVIRRPARAAGVTFGMSSAGQRLDRVLREHAYRDHENALPLLQFTLHELYERRSGRELAYLAYEQLGGLAGSVATSAAAVLEAQAADALQAVPRLFRSLVTVDESGRATRRYAPLAEISKDAPQKQLLVALVGARLCVTDQRDGEAVVALAHEAQLRTWPALVQWLKQEAGLLQTRDLAQREMRLWEQHGRSDAWLAAADKLAMFEALATAGIAVAESVQDFIDRSRRRVRMTTRIKQVAVALIALLAIVASVAGWVASRNEREAEFQTAQAWDAQSRLLTEAAAQRLKDSKLADAQGIILEVLTNTRFAAGYTPASLSVFLETRAADAQIAVLAGHTDFIRSAGYSPDGSRIVTASLDHTARIWDARTGVQLIVLSGHGDRVNSAAYSPDGRQIVTASSDRTARIWDAGTGAQLAVLAGSLERLICAAYSPDGARIVTTSYGKTVRIWDARTGMQLAVLSGHTATVESAAYSPDGSRIVTASADKTARVWDARTGAQLAVLTGHGATVESAAYSPDSTRIVTASDDKTARIWDAHTGGPLAVLSGHGASVYSAAYSHGGAHIVTASADGTARIWDARTGAQLAVLSGHGDRVASAAYSPDDTRIVTASVDQTTRIWDARPNRLVAVLSGHGDRVNSAVYSPDGTDIVTASFDQTARIWDARTGAPRATLSGHTDRVISARYSPEGSRVVTASDDQTARIWDAHTGAQLAVLSGHAGTVQFAAYSPDGTRIVTASFDRTARIWDAHTGQQLTVLSGHGATVESAAFSPDGTAIITASDDQTARIWDARTGQQLAVLSGHVGTVEWAAYSPDGTRIVTTSSDKTTRIWDAHTYEQLSLLSGHGARIQSAVYSPDGTRIVTASDDQTARIWDARTGQQLAVLLGHGDRVVSAAYSPDGTRVVTASADRTARIWDARVPSGIAAQIAWAAAAQVDPLPAIERARLGLAPQARMRDHSTVASLCDRAHALLDGHPRALVPYMVAQGAAVPLAAFDPRQHYESRLRISSGSGADASSLDTKMSRPCYRRNADAEEPDALARLGEQEERRALDEPDPLVRIDLLLKAFRLYASAAERADRQHWPDSVWRNWRYRRATLARLLARDGRMQQVADAYRAVLGM